MADIADIRPLITQLSRLPAPAVNSAAGKDRRELMGAQLLCMCGHMKSVEDLEHIDTGVIRIVSNVCKGCESARREDRRLARIVCCRCKQVVARMHPHITKAGFSYVANTTYHLDRCAACHPGISESCILEETIFNNKNGAARPHK